MPHDSAPADIAQEFDLLHAERLVKNYGGLRAVDQFTLSIGPGELVGLIGPNGAGKTTVFNLLTGLETLDEGDIFFNGYSIAGLPAHSISHRGLSRTFQNIRLLPHLSVLENVKIAYHQHIRYHLFDTLLHTPKFRREERGIELKCREFLELFGLADDADRLAASLPYGRQRKLEIARALATESRLLLLDEPAAGMNPRETSDLMELIRDIKENFHLSILLIEHDMHLVMNICPRIIVLDAGQIIAEGKPEDIRANPAVIEAYLGEDFHKPHQTDPSDQPLSSPSISSSHSACITDHLSCSPSKSSPTPPTLRLTKVQVHYGEGLALKGVSFHVDPGEIVSILGANGAGKSTILRAISGLVPPTTGQILFENENITTAPPHAIVRKGITHCPEGRRIFSECTVIENLEMGGYTLSSPAELRRNIERVLDYFPRLRERTAQLGATLSGGEQQMLGVARALMSNPRLLLLDEPSLGLAPIIVAQLFEIIQRINRDGVTILLVEQNAYEALQLSHRAYVLEAGNIILSGPATDLMKDPRVVSAYLGI